jgi:hypothetical protein
MTQTATLDIRPERDPLATIAASAAPVVLEGRYRLLIRALSQLRHSRRKRWRVGLGSGARHSDRSLIASHHEERARRNGSRPAATRFICAYTDRRCTQIIRLTRFVSSKGLP